MKRFHVGKVGGGWIVFDAQRGNEIISGAQRKADAQAYCDRLNELEHGVQLQLFRPPR